MSRAAKPTMYVIMYVQQGPPHWAIVTGPQENFAGLGGTRYHAIHVYGPVPPQGGPAPQQWQRSVDQCAAKSSSQLVRLIVGKIKPGKLAKVDQILKNVPVVQNNPNWNCFSWLQDACAALRAGHNEVELFEMANLNWMAIQGRGDEYYAEKLAAGRYSLPYAPTPTWDLLEETEAEI